MTGTTSDWKNELGRWLKPFLDRWVTKRDDRCVRYMSRA